MVQHTFVVFTDGAAKGNPGPGGWGAIIVTPGGEVTELGGRAGHTTNNKMELTGAIAALSALRVDGDVARHATWAERERRVKGRAGARFKKAMSAADEASILREWGIER